MSMTLAAQAAAELESWTILIALLVAFAAIVVTLAIIGRRADRSADALQWVPNGLEHVTAIPGWAAGMIGTASFGLLVAGIGFYNDVAWHVGLGRDKELFTAPHTMIIVGLGFIALAAGIGILFATLQRADTALRIFNLRVPWSAIPLGLLGVCALSGFPLDDLWHATYGVDVTMWSPTHMLMICGAAFSLIAAWLALAEAGVSFRQNNWTKAAHFIASWFVLAGLAAPLGEFRFGVPQFQQLFHPLLLMLAAAFAFVPTRLVLGRGWALILGLATFLPESLGLMGGGAGEGFVPTRTPGMFVASAVAVEIVALLFGTERRFRFALLAGVGVGTLGLAGEWLWNRGAPQPWNGVLMRDAFVYGIVVALAAAVLGAAYAGAVLREPGRIPRAAIVVAGVAVLVALVLPMPRRTSDVVAQIDMQRAGDAVSVTVHLEPQDAARDARWFQAIAWQGGGMRVVGLHEVAPGTYASDSPIPVGGKWKAMLRLHTGAVMMSAPIFLPGDPEIGAPEISAESRTIAFGGEEQYLLREVKPGPDTVKVLAYAIISIVSVAWLAAFVLAIVRIPQHPPLRPGRRQPGTPPTPTAPAPPAREPELV